ncbi:MAG: GIY-YIG nuclease family protein [Roseiarcus sp.]|jgi:hypothetical protein
MGDLVLSEIRRLAASNDGRPPGQKLFARETGIAEHQWRGKLWARWGDALIEAGYRPNDWTERLDSDEVLAGVIAACRHFGRLPTYDEIEIYRKSAPSVPTAQAVKRHFGARSNLIAAIAKRTTEDAAFADIAAMLPEGQMTNRTPLARPAWVPEGFVYLIRSGDFYKVGRSDDLERRVKQIRVALPDKATLVHAIRTDDPAGIEAYWHRRFEDKRANGEWFKLASADISAFKKRKFQ